MKTVKKQLLPGQSLEEIRQELLKVGISNIPDQEYIALLTRHTTSLLELVDKLNLRTDTRKWIQSTFTFLFGSLTEPVCVTDNKGRLLYWNPYWNLNYGYLLTKKSEHYYLKSESVNRTIRAFTRESKRQLIILDPDKSPYLISVVPFEGPGMGLSFLIFLIRKELLGTNGEAKRAKKTSLERTILGAIDGFYFSMSGDMMIKEISPSVQKHLQFRASELAGKPFTSLLTGNSLRDYNDEAILVKMFARLHSGETHHNQIEMLDGENIIQHFDFVLTYDKAINQYAALCTSVSRFKEREQELINAKVNAELNDKLKSDFLANMSHEIRTPLNGIIGFSEILGRNHLDATKRDKYLRIIRNSTMQLLTLVNNIIDISKIEAGQLKINYAKVDVHELLEDLYITFVGEARRTDKQNITFIKQTGKTDSGLFLWSDGVRLKQVLTNLLGNALKFTSQGCIIYGYTIENNKTIRFFVRDDGLGIPRNEQKTIFRRFKMSAEGSKNQYKGSGLGLAISKGILELMDGAIGVNSEEGKGAEFYFILPLTECK